MHRRLAVLWLSVTGAAYPEEALADIIEESRTRKRAGVAEIRLRLWVFWELLLVGLYELRDRFRGPSGREQPNMTARFRNAHSPLRMRQAFRLAFRRFRREPGSALTAALTLALGFGAAAAIYATLQGFQRPLPVPEGHEVVRIRLVRPDGGAADLVSPLLSAWRPGGALERLGAFTVQSVALSGTPAGAVRVSAGAMTRTAYELLAVPPIVGRWPDTPDQNVILLSEELWRGRFASDHDILGRDIRVNGVPHAVIGVMPEGFGFPFDELAWTLLPAGELTGAQLVGRLSDGWSTAQAATGVEQTARALLPSLAGNSDLRALVSGFTDDRGEGGEDAALRIVLIIVIALLLVSCANVSNILIVRAASRAHNMALHAALGASPRQVVLQMFAEAITIAGAGAVMGAGVAWIVVSFIEGTLADHWGYFWMRVALEPATLGFILGLAAVTAVVAGTVPARRAARAQPMGVLKRDGPGTAAGGPGWASHLMLGGQIAFSFVALAASLLIAGGLLRGQEVDSDFPAESLLVSSVTLDGATYDSAEDRGTFRRRLVTSLADEEDVAAVALSTGLPGLNAPVGYLELEGVASAPDELPEPVFTHAVSPGFFDLMNLDVLAGRTFSNNPADEDVPVAVVSESFGRRHFGADDPIGRRIRVSGIAPEWHRIVGVVQDPVVYTRERGRARERVYFPIEQLDPAGFFVTAAMHGDPDTARNVIGRAVMALDPDLPVSTSFIPSETGSLRMTEVLAYVRRVVASGGTLALLGGIGGLLVASIGLYGVLAFDVQRRLRELGVRKALGADDGRVLRQVVGWGMRNVVPGLVVGVAIAWFGIPLFGVFLSGADPRDPTIYLALVAGYLGMMGIATLIPAWRAARLDPVQVLEGE